MSRLSCVISGSFRNDFDDSNGRWADSIMSIAGHFEENLGVQVLQPKPAKIVNKGAAFAILSSDDEDASPLALELGYLRAIRDADLHVVFNSNGGRIGRSSAAEMAFARVIGKPTITTFGAAERIGCPLVPYPELWFPEEITPEQQLALLETRDIRLNGCRYDLLTVDAINKIAAGVTPLNHNDPHRTTLSGIYRGLIQELATT